VRYDRLDAALVGAARSRGLRVNSWTLNGPAEVERALALGVTGLITDAPDVALAASRAQVQLAAA
jgi:glycerophosphoryl diester phosphodiesterase